jgi:hypothetical protein
VLFVDADLEPMAGDMSKFAYEVAFGFEPENNILLRAGIMNKFFKIPDLNFIFEDSRINIPEPEDMFTLDKKPFLFAKASFKL